MIIQADTLKFITIIMLIVLTTISYKIKPWWKSLSVFLGFSCQVIEN